MNNLSFLPFSCFVYFCILLKSVSLLYYSYYYIDLSLIVGNTLLTLTCAGGAVNADKNNPDKCWQDDLFA